MVSRRFSKHGIGQGGLCWCLPLQMAEAYSILINRGLDFIPHVGMEVKDTNGEAFAELSEAKKL